MQVLYGEQDNSKREEGIPAAVVDCKYNESSLTTFGICSLVTITQKLIAEVIGTYLIIFAGCGAIAVNKIFDNVVTFPQICLTWSLIVTAMIYTLCHISGAHFNPAVTVAFAVLRRFPYREVSLYIVAQLVASILAIGTCALVFGVTPTTYCATVPAGSITQSLVLEVIISAILMFVVAGAGTDQRAQGQLSGINAGMTIMANSLFAGPISGASMNPARSIGPAIIKQEYKSLWVYMVGPVMGTIIGGLAYNVLRTRENLVNELPHVDPWKKNYVELHQNFNKNSFGPK